MLFLVTGKVRTHRYMADGHTDEVVTRLVEAFDYMDAEAKFGAFFETNDPYGVSVYVVKCDAYGVIQ